MKHSFAAVAIIKAACEEHAKAVTAERDELREQMKQVSDALLVEAEENAALRAQVKRLWEVLEDARGCLCAHKYPLTGADFQFSPWFEEREKTLAHISEALAEQEIKP